MGQKTHPGGFRLNTTQEHYSSWYQKSWFGYAKNLERDDKIRTFKTKITSNQYRKNYNKTRLLSKDVKY